MKSSSFCALVLLTLNLSAGTYAMERKSPEEPPPQAPTNPNSVTSTAVDTPALVPRPASRPQDSHRVPPPTLHSVVVHQPTSNPVLTTQPPSAVTYYRNTIGYKIAAPIAIATVLTTTLLYFFGRNDEGDAQAKRQQETRDLSLWVSIPSSILLFVGLGTQCQLFGRCQQTRSFTARLMGASCLCNCGLFGTIVTAVLLIVSYTTPSTSSP